MQAFPRDQELVDRQARDRAAIEKFIADNEREIEADNPRILGAHINAHNEDKEAYRFECKRHGDFLAMFVERLRLDWKRNLHVSQKEVIAINLGQCSEIKLREGMAPDMNGSHNFEFVQEHKDGRFVREVKLPSFCRRWDAPIWQEAPKESRSGSGCGYYQYAPVSITKDGMARGSQDDILAFSEVGTLYIPHGLGRSVYDKIMREIELAQPTINIKTSA